MPDDDGLPALTRAVADTNVVGILQQSVAAGTNSPLLTNMLNGTVPSMLNGLGSISAQNLLGALNPQIAGADGISQQSQSAPTWGIFDSSGNQVLTPDSIVSVTFSGDYRDISYPIEEGNFETYNKVKEPFEIVVVARKGGTISDRSGFIVDLQTIRESLDLYTVATPEASYVNVNVLHVDYPRDVTKPAMIEATIRLQEINVSASSTFSNTQSPDAADPSSGGLVDAQTPSAQQSAAAAGGAF